MRAHCKSTHVSMYAFDWHVMMEPSVCSMYGRLCVSVTMLPLRLMSIVRLQKRRVQPSAAVKPFSVCRVCTTRVEVRSCFVELHLMMLNDGQMTPSALLQSCTVKRLCSSVPSALRPRLQPTASIATSSPPASIANLKAVSSKLNTSRMPYEFGPQVTSKPGGAVCEWAVSQAEPAYPYAIQPTHAEAQLRAAGPRE